MMPSVIAAEMGRLWGALEIKTGQISALARAAGATPTSAGEWVHGKTPPSPEYWPAIERFFKLPSGHFAKLEAGAAPPRRRREAQWKREDPAELAQEVARLWAMFERLALRLGVDPNELIRDDEEPQTSIGQ